jgi:hypothetical protein
MHIAARHSDRWGLVTYRLAVLVLCCLVSAATVWLLFGLLIEAALGLMLIGILVGIAARSRHWSDRGVIISLCGAGLLFGPTLYLVLGTR